MLATLAATLTLPPSGGSYGVVPSWWGDSAGGVMPEIELEIWSTVAVSLTSVILYGARPHAIAIADVAITSTDNSTDQFTKNGHGLQTGDGPMFHTAATTFPTGLDGVTPYWIIRTGANTYKYAASRDAALAGTAVPFSTNGTGQQTTVDLAPDTNATYPRGTERLDWCSHSGLLGHDGDGAIAVAPGVGYSTRIPHSPRVVAYSLVGTLDTGTVSAGFAPIQDAS